MSLQEYHKKRDFAKTPEPAGSTEQEKKNPEHKTSTSNLRFVVQRHEARRLHYDFRLETQKGALKSWAIPKDISINPKVKRLAVMTEDHPVDYLLLEGVIPEGNYGAGTVIVWDTGTYITQQELLGQIESGKISFSLFGQKLRGRYSLVKSDRDENQWFLIKANDEFASVEEQSINRHEPVLTGRTNKDLKYRN
jgi:bifunctional non-homologous end joining protein LigD